MHLHKDRPNGKGGFTIKNVLDDVVSRLQGGKLITPRYAVGKKALGMTPTGKAELPTLFSRAIQCSGPKKNDGRDAPPL